MTIAVANHDRREVTAHAVRIIRDGCGKQFRACMRTQFPRVTNRMLREAEADARLIIAIDQVMAKRRARE